MEKSRSTILLISCVLISFLGVTSAQACKGYALSNNKAYTTCVDLPVLSSYLHWTYSSNGTVDLAFTYTAATTSTWISWAINPSGQKMVGSQALVAYQESNGTMRAYTSSIDAYRTSLAPSSLSFAVPSINATFQGSAMTIFATLELGNASTTINQVWQEGPLKDGTPAIHTTNGTNVQSVGTLDLQSGATTAAGGNSSQGGNAQTCGEYALSNNKVYTKCVNLPVLSSYLHWTYSSNGTVDLAFTYIAATTSTWISWAINPSGQKMVGSQALVAYQQSDGTMRAYTSSIDAYGTSLPESSLSFAVPSINATFQGSAMTIFATLELGSGSTTINQVWQEGPMSGGAPTIHSTSGANVQSMGTLDWQSGTATATSGNSRQRRRNVHGVLNAVSWGTLMPLGAIFARYLKVFHDPAWFYLHILCQTSAYGVGVAGWATGLKLGSDSSLDNDVHGNIGIVLFALGTLQVFALLLRPKKDHKYRLYWNIYHHLTGYTVIVLSIINVFKGLDILDPEKKWKRAYIGILIFYGVCVVILEPLTWYIVLIRKKASESDKVSHSMNGRSNGHGNGIARDEI